MRLILKISVAIFCYFVLLLPGSVKAQQWCGGCQVVCTEVYIDGVKSELCVDGCNGCIQTPCESGEYQAPNGECYPVGTGGACQCGAYPNGSCKSCGDTGGGYQFPTCGGSQVLACANPPVYAGGCTFKATCGGTYFPSAFYPDDCAGEDNPNRGACQDNCGCCSPGQEYIETSEVFKTSEVWKFPIPYSSSSKA
jgi:hypothetical protein